MVEGARLESVYAGNRIVGSNPTPSAINPIICNEYIYLGNYKLYNPSIYPSLRPNFTLILSTVVGGGENQRTGPWIMGALKCLLLPLKRT